VNQVKFYRLATEDDFNKRCEIEIGHFEHYLPSEVEKLIEEDQFNKAVSKLRELRGFGIESCKIICQEYKGFINAKRDFNNGKSVYTDY
jgi:hypothetical protein